MQYRTQPGRKNLEILSYRAGKQALMGSINPENLRFKPSKHHTMTPEEEIEVRLYLESLQNNRTRENIASLEEYFRKTADHLRKNPEDAKTIDAQGFYEELGALLSAMNKAGVKRIVKKREAKEDVLPGEKLMFQEEQEITNLETEGATNTLNLL